MFSSAKGGRGGESSLQASGWWSISASGSQHMSRRIRESHKVRAFLESFCPFSDFSSGPAKKSQRQIKKRRRKNFSSPVVRAFLCCCGRARQKSEIGKMAAVILLRLLSNRLAGGGGRIKEGCWVQFCIYRHRYTRESKLAVQLTD